MSWNQVDSAEQALAFQEHAMKYCDDTGEHLGRISRSYSVGGLVYFKEEVSKGIVGWINPQRLRYYTESKRKEMIA